MSASPFALLWSKILDSSVWVLDHPTRIVWITMLAMKDANGMVKASVPGLANRAVVSLGECEAALKKFSDPDPYSQSVNEEGRRIKVIPGGWLIINHEAYRFASEAKRAIWRELKAKQRANKKGGPITAEAGAVAAMGRGDEVTADALAAERRARANEDREPGWMSQDKARRLKERAAPGGDLDEPPVETLDHLPDSGKVMVPATNSPASGYLPKSVRRRGSSTPKEATSSPEPVQSEEPPVEEALAAAEIEREFSDAPAGVDQASPATLQSQSIGRADARAPQAAPAVPKPLRPPSPPSPVAANASTVAAIRGNSGGPGPGVSRAAPGGPPESRAGGSQPQGAGGRSPLPQPGASQSAPADRGAASVRPNATPAGPRSAGQILAGVNLPKRAPVNPNQLDRMPRTEAGVIAGTGEGSAFGGWEERTVTPKPHPK